MRLATSSATRLIVLPNYVSRVSLSWWWNWDSSVLYSGWSVEKNWSYLLNIERCPWIQFIRKMDMCMHGCRSRTICLIAPIQNSRSSFYPLALLIFTHIKKSINLTSLRPSPIGIKALRYSIQVGVEVQHTFTGPMISDWDSSSRTDCWPQFVLLLS